ncbi:MAG: hypothetical protein NTW78_10140 [Campylobacterales bacterium]|nr:hypothetical protein [Campylobacterales bacterium]
MTKLNLLQKLIRKIVWRKNKNIRDMKIIIFSFILYFFLFGLFMPSIILMKYFIYLSLIFLSISVYYYTFVANDDEYNLIINMWKIYFSIISLMFIMMFSIESYTNNILLDSYKQKVMYQLKINSLEVNSTFNEYESLVKEYLSGYEKKKVDYKKIFIPEEKAEEEYTIWYINIGYTVMIITTLFMFLWMFNELKYFKKNVVNQSNYYSKK